METTPTNITADADADADADAATTAAVHENDEPQAKEESNNVDMKTNVDDSALDGNACDSSGNKDGNDDGDDGDETDTNRPNANVNTKTNDEQSEKSDNKNNDDDDDDDDDGDDDDDDDKGGANDCNDYNDNEIDETPVENDNDNGNTNADIGTANDDANNEAGTEEKEDNVSSNTSTNNADNISNSNSSSNISKYPSPTGKSLRVASSEETARFDNTSPKKVSANGNASVNVSDGKDYDIDIDQQPPVDDDEFLSTEATPQQSNLSMSDSASASAPATNTNRTITTSANTSTHTSKQRQQQRQKQQQQQQQQPKNLFNKFATWKSKADAVIQSSEVLKAAQKNIQEKQKEVQKEVQKVVGINFGTGSGTTSTTNSNSNFNSSGGPVMSGSGNSNSKYDNDTNGGKKGRSLKTNSEDSDLDSEGIVEFTSTNDSSPHHNIGDGNSIGTNENANKNANGNDPREVIDGKQGSSLKNDETGKINGHVQLKLKFNGDQRGSGITSASASASGSLLDGTSEGDDLSKQSRLTYDDDDDEFSYDSKEPLRNDEYDSEQSSIYIDHDDFSHSTYSSDQSSIRVQSRSPRRRSNNNNIRNNSINMNKNRQSSTSGSTMTISSVTVPPPHSSSDGLAAPRQLFKTEDMASKKTATKKKNPSATDGKKNIHDFAASFSKGRYAHQIVSRPTILKQLQRKVRAPSPPPSIPESPSSSSSLLASNPKRRDSTQEAHDKQASKIRKLLPAAEMESMVGDLSPGEYLMYLGPGMLGVNLKQTFLKGYGVYIDFIVPGGNAHKSGVIWIGDRLIKVGSTDVSKGTIYDVPGIIARMKRPLIMVLDGEHNIDLERMDNLTVAIGMINQIQYDAMRKNANELVTEKIRPPKKRSLSSHPHHPPSPAYKVRKSLQEYAVKRTNEIASFSALAFACKNDENLRHALQKAFMTCCVDNRRLPFFAAFISNEDSFLADSEREPESKHDFITGSSRLMLFLEIISFRDLFGVTPIQRKLYAAKRIAFKFILPQTQKGDESNNNNRINPQFDMRSMFPSEQISKLAKSIEEENITHDLFCDIEDSLWDSFGGMKFASFLLSDECARMRAYMRGTSPYLDPSLEMVFNESLDAESKHFSSARNHLEYIIVYLLCQYENDVMDKNYNNGKQDEKTENNRLVGAPGGICCSIFIKRTLIPSINKAKELLLRNQTEGTEMDHVGQTLIDSFSWFWECFIASSGGTLESTPLSNDTQIMLDKVRRSVSLAASPPRNFSKEERRRHIIRSLALNADLSKSLLRLREELIYDYSVNAHPKYRGHTIHEWMCTEANKAERIESENSEELKSGDAEADRVNSVPTLPSGSISRLIRQLELPDGLSRHCPEVIATHTPDSVKHEEGSRCNADFVVVFGTDNTASKSQDVEIPNEGATPSFLRRFVCAPMSKRAKESCMNGMNTSDLVPPTLESYAYVPTLGDRQFQHVTDSTRRTIDGWEVSLVNFMMPSSKNDNVSDDGFLYGVSLILNCNTDKISDEVTIEFFNEKEHKITWSQENDKPKLSIFIDAKVDTFNDILRQMSLSEIIKKQRETAGSNSSACITLGITLVSHQNVIPSMRKTLSRLFGDVSCVDETHSSRGIAAPFASILESFRSKEEIEVPLLTSLLNPYLDFGWKSLSMPSVSKQKQTFETSAIEALVESITPIPLALLFITALLEQKIVFTSRRRSNLVSMTVALRQLLKPLEWPHLFVPLVPDGLANDLIQYPAPFILGIPFTPDSMNLLKSIPENVTIVDVDVGRVILTKNFSTHFDTQGTNEEKKATTASLRSQVLHLAETLGGVIGSKQSDRLWACDSPHVDSIELILRKGEAVQNVTRDFLRELLAGSGSCCFWIEEERAAPSSSTTSEEDASKKTTKIEHNVLFDEDRFYHLKRLRSDGMYIPLFNDEDFFPASTTKTPTTSTSTSANTVDNKANAHAEQMQISSKLDTQSTYSLSLDHFDLIIDTFLRGQLLSSHLSSRRKETMSFW